MQEEKKFSHTLLKNLVENYHNMTIYLFFSASNDFCTIDTLINPQLFLCPENVCFIFKYTSD